MKKKLFIFSLIILIIVAAIFMLDSRLKVVEYKIESDKISSEVRFVLITDLHSCLYGENQSQLLDEIKKYQPDAVFLGGDIFDDVYVNNNGHILVDVLSSEYKTYYVSGNHEWWGNEIYRLFDYLDDAGVFVLRGNNDTLKIGENEIVVSGIDDPDAEMDGSVFKSYEQQLKGLGQSIDNECFNILLSHRPENASQYFSYDFDLVLTGHAHGGQFRIPFVLNGFYAPNQGFFPGLAGGMYDFGKGKLIVSRGLSRENTNLPRIFNRPELVFVSVN